MLLGNGGVAVVPILYDTIRAKNDNMMGDGSLQADLEWPWEEILTDGEAASP